MNDLNIEIGKRIAQLRREHHLTQEQLAEMLDISVKHCSAVERGISSLSTEKYISLCNIFNTSLDYLIRGYPFDYSCQIPPFLNELFCNADEKELKLLKEYCALYTKIRKL